nr:hypothetical protein [Mycoplasmopsis bovigenitalium]
MYSSIKCQFIWLFSSTGSNNECQLLCFISVVLLKLIKLYVDYGVIDHLSEQKLINILSKLRERVDINSKTKEIIKRQREDSKTVKDI